MQLFRNALALDGDQQQRHMSRALSESLGWLRRQALSYLAVLAVLLAGSWLLNEYRRASSLSTQLEEAGAVAQQRRTALARAYDSVELADEALAAKLAALRAARDLARRELLAKEREREAHRMQHWPWAGLHGPGALAQSRLLDEQAAALRHAEHAAQSRLEAAESMQNSVAALEQLQEEARNKRADADRLRAQWRALSAANPYRQRLPWASVRSELDRLKNEVERLQQEAVDAEAVVSAAGQSQEVAEWLGRRAALDAARAALRETESAQAALAQSLDQNRFQRLRLGLRAFLADKGRFFLLAFAILVAAILTRLAVKLLLYFVVAPLASRRPPVRLLGAYEPRAFARPVLPGWKDRISSESLTVRVGPGEELLVRPEFLQSSPEHASKRTAWLLNGNLPFTSIASGMYLLTRVRSPEGHEVVLSPSGDPFDEVCMIELPSGAAMVCQPRSLAGVVQPVDQTLRVTRHWRIRSLHAWLTFQLRFLVFHGPCKLVLKGRRGIRMEPAGAGRLVSQAATLGFDASVPYSTVRTETFVPYWLGKDDLFNDRFGGIDGSYLYEERPLDRRGNALTGRGLQGLSEAVLKVFGI
jgi:hypothetical protein